MNNSEAGHRLTIIIATYRRNELLAECLSSIDRQRKDGYKDFDVIVADDGGGQTDKAKQIADPSYVRFLDITENRGQPAAQAKAAALTDSEILAFLDDDATVESDWAGEIVRYFDRWPSIGAVLGRIEPKDTSRLLARTRQVIYDKRRRKYTSREFMQKISAEYGFSVPEGCTGLSDHVSGGSFAIRRHVYDAVGGLPADVPMGCDTLFSRQLLEGGFPIGYDENMVILHRHSTSYRVLCRNSFREGRDWVKIQRKCGKSRGSLALPCVWNLVKAPFKIARFPEMLTADRWYIRAYGVYTMIHLVDGIGRLVQLCSSEKTRN